MRRLLALFVATSALAFSAATAAAEPSLIAIGRSIGAIRLGMAEADVVQVYGKPRKVEHIELADGGSARLASYHRHGGGFRITYGTGNLVVGINTAARYYRTSGIGPGSLLAAAVELPGFHFDQCTAGYVREARRALTFFVAYTRPGTVSHVSIVRPEYFDC